MKKILCIIFVFCAVSLSANEDIIEELKFRISDSEHSKELLTDASDIYSYYYQLGKQAAYHECIDIILKSKE